MNSGRRIECGTAVDLTCRRMGTVRRLRRQMVLPGSVAGRITKPPRLDVVVVITSGPVNTLTAPARMAICSTRRNESICADNFVNRGGAVALRVSLCRFRSVLPRSVQTFYSHCSVSAAGWCSRSDSRSTQPNFAPQS